MDRVSKLTQPISGVSDDVRVTQEREWSDDEGRARRIIGVLM